MQYLGYTYAKKRFKFNWTASALFGSPTGEGV